MKDYMQYIIGALGAAGVVAIIAYIKKMFFGTDNGASTNTAPDTTEKIEKAKDGEDKGGQRVEDANSHTIAGDKATDEANKAKAEAERLQNEINAAKEKLKTIVPDTNVPSEGEPMRDELNELLHKGGNPSPVQEQVDSPTTDQPKS